MRVKERLTISLCFSLMTGCILSQGVPSTFFIPPQLKGVPSSEVVPQCEEMLRDTELLPKLNARSKTLSGGMKRKLSVCIALIGNSKVTFRSHW